MKFVSIVNKFTLNAPIFIYEWAYNYKKFV